MKTRRMHIASGIGIRVLLLLLVFIVILEDDNDHKQYPLIVERNSIVQWDSGNIPSILLVKSIAKYILAGTAILMASWFIQTRRIIRSQIRSYTLLFPLSIAVDFICVLLLQKKLCHNIDLSCLFTGFNCAFLYQFYALDVSSLLRFVFAYCISVYRRYAIKRMFFYVGLLAIHVIILIVIPEKCYSYILGTLSYITDPNDFISMQSCEDWLHEITLPENKTLPNTVVDIYYDAKGCHHNSTFETTVTVQVPSNNFKEYKRVDNEDVSIQCVYYMTGQYAEYIDPYPVIWKHKGKPISNSYKYYISSNEHTWSASSDQRRVESNLTIYALKSEDYDEYQCIYTRLQTLMINETKYTAIVSNVMGRYFVKRLETPPCKQFMFRLVTGSK